MVCRNAERKQGRREAPTPTHLFLSSSSSFGATDLQSRRRRIAGGRRAVCCIDAETASRHTHKLISPCLSSRRERARHCSQLPPVALSGAINKLVDMHDMAGGPQARCLPPLRAWRRLVGAMRVTFLEQTRSTCSLAPRERASETGAQSPSRSAASHERPRAHDSRPDRNMETQTDRQTDRQQQQQQNWTLKCVPPSCGDKKAARYAIAAEHE